MGWSFLRQHNYLGWSNLSTGRGTGLPHSFHAESSGPWEVAGVVQLATYGGDEKAPSCTRGWWGLVSPSEQSLLARVTGSFAELMVLWDRKYLCWCLNVVFRKEEIKGDPRSCSVPSSLLWSCRAPCTGSVPHSLPGGKQEALLCVVRVLGAKASPSFASSAAGFPLSQLQTPHPGLRLRRDKLLASCSIWWYEGSSSLALSTIPLQRSSVPPLPPRLLRRPTLSLPAAGPGWHWLRAWCALAAEVRSV